MSPDSIRLGVADVLDDVFDGFFVFGVLLHVFDYLTGRVYYGRVVAAAKLTANRSHGHLGDLADDVHGNLSGVGNLRGTLGGADVLGADTKGPANLGNDALNGDGNRLVVGQNLPDGALCKKDGRRGLRQLVVGVELLYNSFELADVVLDMVCNVFLYAAGNLQIEQLGFALDDSNSGLEIRRLDVCNQTPFKPGAQTLFERLDLLRRTVGGQDNLFACLIQGKIPPGCSLCRR